MQLVDTVISEGNVFLRSILETRIAQCNPDGEQFLLMESITDHKKDEQSSTVLSGVELILDFMLYSWEAFKDCAKFTNQYLCRKNRIKGTFTS